MVLLQQTRLAFFLALCVLFLSSSTAEDDAAVMLKLAEGRKNTPKDWSTGKTYCDWEGIECVGNRVATVNLSSMSLSGSLPSNLNSLTQLTTLSLQSNSLSGSFPSLANLSALQQIFLDTNNFTSIPSGCFQGLSSLQVLSMSQNINLDPWVFPTELIQASSLVTLAAGNANLYGSLPDIFA
ncbi:receptor-like kinase TMK4, partial [Prunus avium]|uniref:Receptor-like kinase TMK4 n=1 Tax=Prunus avium TaxID=42229 RepID=A0A6P5S3K0_PRUAV